jgi:NADH dehydrogenase (ubiquinone) Fe-S protein 1
MAPLVGGEGASVLSSLNALRTAVPNLVTPTWNGISVLQTATSNMAAHDIGFRQGVTPPASPKFVYLLGADEFDESRIPRDAFVVYQGHHGDAGANRANVILAGAAYTEKTGTYVNVEGRVQRSYPSSTLIAQARDDWAIIRALSEVVGAPLPYDSLDAVRQRLVDVAPHFGMTTTLFFLCPINDTLVLTCLTVYYLVNRYPQSCGSSIIPSIIWFSIIITINTI